MTSTLRVEDLEYELPQERIATQPVSPRSSAKLFVIDQEMFVHKHVFDLPTLLPENALLVVNETSVLPARFITKRVDSGGRVEGLFLDEVGGNWNVMLQSNGKLREGILLELCNGVELELVERVGKNWKCTCSSKQSAQEVLASSGLTPIPPYIRRARGESIVEDQIDRKQYQTMYADVTQNKSIAAPTAGLHFDDDLLQALEDRGVERVPVTLHVGAGTFKAIETDKIDDHEMHTEQWSVNQNTLDAIRAAKFQGRSVIAVGTTTVRTLESLPPMDTWPTTGGLEGITQLMISPPYEFCIVDGMLTNFHLPKSTLLALVAGMIGIDLLKEAYAIAIEKKYRFYSYGDAMFILPR